MEARSFAHPGEKGITKGAEIAKGSVPIHFDAKSHSFTVPHEQVSHGGHTTTVFAP